MERPSIFQVRFLKVNLLEGDEDVVASADVTVLSEQEEDTASVKVTELSEDISLKKVALGVCKTQPRHQGGS